MKSVAERFLSYIKVDTQADENSMNSPSSNGQVVFSKMLEKELLEMGLDVIRTEKSYIYAHIKSNIKGNKTPPPIGFIAHMDTSPAMSGKDIKAKIIPTYDGSDIKLNKNIYLSPRDFPEILQYINQDIIVTDGTTLLGSDDKAGVAAIMSAIEEICELSDFKHGDLYFAFTTDEEIGRSADYFDLQHFPAKWAYTIDGGELGELEYENFNAAIANITICGNSVHPGYAKGKMVNSILVANQIITPLSLFGLPEETSEYEGFIHLDKIEGNVEKTTLTYIIRDFDMVNFNKRKEYIQKVIDTIQHKNQKSRIEYKITDQYFNMYNVIVNNMEIIEVAKKAMEEIGIKPLIKPIRGGTDGARLSFMGLPCPNIFAGGHNFHSKFEYLPVQSLEKSKQTILKIIEKVST